MHSYYPYWASACPEAKQNRAFVVGLEIPDLLNDYRQKYKKNGLSEAHAVYMMLQEEVSGLPDFNRFFAERLQQKERMGCTFGLHFGEKERPDVKVFWNWLPNSEKDNPFWRGFLWHLLTDALIKPRLDTSAKVKAHIDAQRTGNSIDVKAMQAANGMLEADWRKVNYLLLSKYPDVKVTPEVEELGTNIVQNGSAMNLQFIDWTILTAFIDFLRSFDPLGDNINETIKQILSVA